METNSNPQSPALYLIPGLGCDRQIFIKLEAKGIQFKVIEYIQPKKKERFESYALRMAESIDQSQPFIIGGVSFGGLTAMEISRHLNPVKVILISSAKHGGEIPWFLKVFRFIPVQKFFPAPFYKRLAKLAFSTFVGKLGTEEDARKRDEMIDRYDAITMKWQMNTAVHWKHKMEKETDVFHIHGSRDRIFPHKFIQKAKILENADHLLIVNKVDEVADFIRSVMENTPKDQVVNS